MKKYIYLFFAILSFIYYLWLGIHNSFRMSVLPFWLLLSLFFLAAGFLFPRLSPVIKRILRICFAVLLLFFLLVESCILWGMTRNGHENLDYIIVLGAGLNGDKPSSVLEKRLESALAYLDTHPETKVVVSGGQGANEIISEAESMKRWLLQMGISESRILTENQSTTTAENMRYSFSCIFTDCLTGESYSSMESCSSMESYPPMESCPSMESCSPIESHPPIESPASDSGNAAAYEDCANYEDDLNINIGIATSNFHVFRSLCIANKAGEENSNYAENYSIYGIAADFSPLLLPHYMVREFFTICVDAALGNMRLGF